MIFLLVADAASALQGKLFMHGGGITRITPPAFPWAQPLAFCIRLLVDDDDDLSAPRTVTFHMTDPKGAALVRAGDFTVPPMDENAWIAGEERSMIIVVTVSTLVFAQPGLYEIELLIDGVSTRRLTLPAVLP